MSATGSEQRTQIVVLGMHRSGTSLIAGLCRLMGAYVGPAEDLLPPRPDNPRGFWERKDLSECNETLLKDCNCGWHRVAEFSPDRVPPRAARRLERSAQIILADLNAHRPSVMKDPRLCLVLPLWRPLLDNALCVLVHRDPIEVAMSLQRRNSFPLPFGLALWEKYVVSALNAVRTLPHVFVSFSQIVRDPVEGVSLLHDALQAPDALTLPSDEDILAYVERRPTPESDQVISRSSLMTEAQRGLWEGLRSGLEHMPGGLKVSDAALDVLRAFERRAYAGFPLKKKALYQYRRLTQQPARHARRAE